MTLAGLIASDVTNVFFNTDDFAIQLKRYVGGITGNMKLITAATVEVMSTQIDDTRGRGYIHEGAMVLKDTTAITPTDAIVYEGDRYEVKEVAAPEYGLRTVMITRYEPETQGLTPLKNSDH